MQDKTWYSILGLDAEPLFLQDHMLSLKFQKTRTKIKVVLSLPSWLSQFSWPSIYLDTELLIPPNKHLAATPKL